MVRANLRVAAVDLCLGASRAVLVGNAALGCCRRSRENRVQYFVPCRHSGGSHNGRRVSGWSHGRHEHGCDDAIHSHSIGEQPGFVDRTLSRSSVPGRSDPIAPPWWADLTRTCQKTQANGFKRALVTSTRIKLDALQHLIRMRAMPVHALASCAGSEPVLRQVDERWNSFEYRFLVNLLQWRIALEA